MVYGSLSPKLVTVRWDFKTSIKTVLDMFFLTFFSYSCSDLMPEMKEMKLTVCELLSFFFFKCSCTKKTPMFHSQPFVTWPMEM